MHTNKRGAATLTLFLIIILFALVILFLLYLLTQPSEIQKLIQNTEQTFIPEQQGIQKIPPSYSNKPIQVQTSEIENEIHNLINLQRTSRGQQPLELDSRMTLMSRAYSFQQHQQDFINHTDLQGIGFSDRFDNNKIYNLCAGENLFLIENFPLETDIAEASVDGWMNSEGHKANVLNVEYTHTGIGVFCDEQKCLATQNFACLRTTIQETLDSNSVYFFSLYSEEKEFNIVTNLKLLLLVKLLL